MASAQIGALATTARKTLLPYILPAFAIMSALVLPAMAVFLDTYDYPHGWVSAHFATIARSYIEHGILALGGVPIQNNAPLTAMPDAYLNWPPLYPLLLAGVFSVFGETETVQHLFASTINITLGGTIAAIVFRRFGMTAAAVAAIAFFNAPMIAQYGHAGSQLHLALALCAIGLWLFGIAGGQSGRLPRSGWIAAAGCVTFSLSVLASWEPVLAVPGLAAAAVFMRDWRAFRLAILYGLCGFLAICAVFGLYWSEYPYFGDAILQRIMLRAGFDVTYDPAVSAMFDSPHFIQESHEPRRPVGLGYLADATVFAVLAQGALGAAGIALCYRAPIWRRGGNPIAYMIAGFAAVYLLWATLMSQHLAAHHYQMLLLAPLAAIAVGAVAGSFRDLTDRQGSKPLSKLTQVALIGAIIAVAVGDRYSITGSLIAGREAGRSDELRFATHIRDMTEPGSIVVHADRSMVPVYYSERHIIRSVRDEATLAEHRAGIEDLCSVCPIYVAIPDRFRDRFGEFIAAHTPVSNSELGAIIQLR